MISPENYEEYMMLQADGELEPAEEQELMAFLDVHPELKSEMAAYILARFSPDENIIYTEKQSLLRKEPKRTIALPQWRRYAPAAGIAALMCVSLLIYREKNSDTVEIVKVDAVKTPLPVPKGDLQMPSRPALKTDTQSIALSPVQPARLAPAIDRATHVSATRNKQLIVTKKENDAVGNNTTTVSNARTEINTLSIAQIKPLPCKIAQTSLPMAIVPAYEISIPDQPAKRSFIDRLPLDEANKRQLKTIAHITSGATRGVSKVKEELDGNALTLNINNKIRISL